MVVHDVVAPGVSEQPATLVTGQRHIFIGIFDHLGIDLYQVVAGKAHGRSQGSPALRQKFFARKWITYLG